MPKGHLMDSQVREVEAAIRASDLPVEDFKWDERDSQFWTGFVGLHVPTLVYWPDQSFNFSFEYHLPFRDPYGVHHDPGGHQVYFLPGREAPFEHRRHLTWAKVLLAVEEWLQYVAREKGITPPESEPQPNVEKPRSRSVRPTRGALVPTPMPNRVYASRSGQIITVTPIGELTPAVRKAGRISAVDFDFAVAINLGEPQRVRVAVATEVLTDLEPWSAKPESLEVIGRGGGPQELATDLCIARILEAIDQGTNFDQDFELFPDSFLVIRELPRPINKIATVQMDEDIKDYISRRLYAARGACRETYHPEQCAQFFERPDWFYLKVGQPDFLRVIREYMDDRWKKPFREEEFYLLWTDSLAREMHEAKRATGKASGPDPQGDRLPLSPPASRGGDGKELQPSAHPTRERVLGAPINRWLEQEAERRGRLWAVVAVVAGLALAAMAL